MGFSHYTGKWPVCIWSWKFWWYHQLSTIFFFMLSACVWSVVVIAQVPEHISNVAAQNKTSLNTSLKVHHNIFSSRVSRLQWRILELWIVLAIFCSLLVILFSLIAEARWLALNYAVCFVNVFSYFWFFEKSRIDHFGRWTLDRNFDLGPPDDAIIYISNALPH
jgi:hypothetical protein